MSFGLKLLCVSACVVISQALERSRRTALGQGKRRTGGWRGWTKLTMARPPDDDGTEAYIDEAATIIYNSVNVMMTFHDSDVM